MFQTVETIESWYTIRFRRQVSSADHVIGQADFTSYGILGSSGNIYNSQHLYSPLGSGFMMIISIRLTQKGSGL